MNMKMLLALITVMVAGIGGTLAFMGHGSTPPQTGTTGPTTTPITPKSPNLVVRGFWYNYNGHNATVELQNTGTGGAVLTSWSCYNFVDSPMNASIPAGATVNATIQNLWLVQETRSPDLYLYNVNGTAIVGVHTIAWGWGC